MRTGKAFLAIGGLVGALSLSVSSTVVGQTVDYEETTRYISTVGNRLLVDAPTAATLPRGSFDLNFQVNAGGALTAATNVGLSEFLMVGFSYGANGVFSQDYPSYNPNVEFSVKWRLTEESKVAPGLALGFTSQGAGPYLDGFNRSTYKPKGFYGVFSKGIGITGYAWELHGGANYSIETADNVAQTDRGVNFFGGLSTELRSNLRFAVEYDFAMDDNRSGAPFGRGRGYLNAALKWVYFDNLQIEFTARDLLSNRREAESFERGLRIVYLEYF
jgi:hypothetical protein